jgi:hypothetical protein
MVLKTVDTEVIVDDYFSSSKRKIHANYREFNSINEFSEYIATTPINETFRWETLLSSGNDYHWTKTHNFDEALQLLQNGDDTIAKKLTEKIKLTFDSQGIKKAKTTYSMAGYQASVPRYLQGMPDSMIAKKLVVCTYVIFMPVSENDTLHLILMLN